VRGEAEKEMRARAGWQVEQRKRLTARGKWCISYNRKRWSLSDLLPKLRHSISFKGAQA
jgi:hypothetical protein